MLHSVGCNQPDPAVFVNTFNKSGVQKGVHAFLGADGTVLQTLPWNHRAWHCGQGSKGSGNDTHIGIEMTEPATIKYTSGANFVDNDPAKTKTFVLATYKVAVELFAHLCKQFNFYPLADGVILSHAEAHKRGIASNHGDVEHIWKFHGLTMDKFRQDIKTAMSGSVPAKPDPHNSGQNTVPFNLLGRRMDIPGKIIDGKTYAQARPLVEALGYDIGMKDGIIEVRAKTSGKIDVTSEELNILQKITYAEAGGEDEMGQILVVNVILNRVNRKGFPNSIKDVVFQANAFEPTRNGAYERAAPSAATIAAVNKALQGVDHSKGATYFRSLRGISAQCWHEAKLTMLFDHGGHRFYH